MSIQWAEYKVPPKNQDSYSLFPLSEFDRVTKKAQPLYVVNGKNKLPFGIIYEVLFHRYATSTGKNSKRVQCYNDRARSREDIMRLLKPVMPEITFSLTDFIMTRLESHRYVQSHFCTTVLRKVYVPGSMGIRITDIKSVVNQAIKDYAKKNKPYVTGETRRVQ